MPIIRKFVHALPSEEAFKAYSAIVEQYKIQNPVKYQAKKAFFEKKLADLSPKKEKLDK